MDRGSGSIWSACRTRKVQQVDKLHFSDETDVHVLSEIYEDLLKRVAADSAGCADEFYTQRHIIRAMVEVVHPKPGDRVYDPGFGTAGCSLLEDIQTVLRDSIRKSPDEGPAATLDCFWMSLGRIQRQGRIQSTVIRRYSPQPVREPVRGAS